MKLLLLIYSGPTPQRISALLEAHEAPGYTEFPNVRGAGPTGRIEGSRAWPGTATVFFSVVPEERVAELREAILAYRASASPGEHLHAAVMPTDAYI